MLEDNDAIKCVFINKNNLYIKSKFHKDLHDLLGNGIFLSEGEEWKRQHDMIAPFFQHTRMEPYVNEMKTCAVAMMDRMATQSLSGKPISFAEEAMRFTLEVVLGTFLDSRIGLDQTEGFRERLGRVLRTIERRIWQWPNLPLGFQRLIDRSYSKSLRSLQSFVETMVMAYPDDEGGRSEFISTLRKSSHDRDSNFGNLLRDQIMSVLVAGHETSANALTWAVFELARNPAICDRAREEADQIEVRNINSENARELIYIQAVIYESLRLYPPVWTMSRDPLSNHDIPIGDGTKLSIRKNQTVVVCPYTYHRSRLYWDDPEVFKPERFVEKPIRGFSGEGFIPFGTGARICLGAEFAILELTIALVIMLQRFEFRLVDPGRPITPEPLITLRPQENVCMYFKQRRGDDGQ